MIERATHLTRGEVAERLVVERLRVALGPDVPVLPPRPDLADRRDPVRHDPPLQGTRTAGGDLGRAEGGRSAAGAAALRRGVTGEAAPGRDRFAGRAGASPMTGTRSPQTWGRPSRPGTESPSSSCSHQIPSPSSMISRSARCSALASSSHAYQDVGIVISRPSLMVTRRRPPSTTAALARGRVSGEVIEVLMPAPQHHVATPDHDPSDAFDLAGSVPPSVSQAHGRQPEDGCSVTRPDVNMWRLAGLLVLVRKEGEPIRPQLIDGWHAHLADWLGGAVSMPLGAYRRLTT